MSDVKKKKFTTWVIVILVLLNIGTLSIIALQNFRWKANTKPEVRSELSMRFLAKQLEFSEEQVASLQELRKRHFEEIRPIMSQMRETRKQLFTQLNTEDVDSTQVELLTQEIGMLVAQQERQTFIHFNEIKALCNDEQLEKFNKFSGRIAMMLTPDGRRPDQQRRRRDQDGRKDPPKPPSGN